jgi:glutamate dehydrogenase/leucine dehydrogenase
VPIHTLEGTDAFVVTDLPGAPATGTVRVARKVLVASATELARSVTYSFAAFGIRRGGASAGINAEGDAAGPALEAFTAEVAPLVAAGLHLDPGRGVPPGALAGLAAGDRNPLAGSAAVTAAGVVAAVEAALGPLEGRTVAVEGCDAGPVPAAVVSAVAGRGAKVVAASTAAGAVSRPEGIPPGALASGAVDGLGPVGEAHTVWAAAADVVLCGSRPGVMTHHAVPFVRARAVVPWGPVPLTTKALVDLEKAGVVVVADFVAAAGGLLAGYLDGDEAAVTAEVTARVAEVVRAVRGHADGPFLGACHRAEGFLRSWVEALPFGRPLAA